MVADPEVVRQIDVVGRVSDEELWRRLGEADVLCAPSLAGESFGMVLIEAMAAGTPRDRLARSPAIATWSPTGSMAFSCRPRIPSALAEELQRLWHEPERRAAMGDAGRRIGRALRLAARLPTR